MPVHRRVTPGIFASTHSCTWGERATVRVKCLEQEHNTMSPARTRTRTTQSGVEHTNHEAATPPSLFARPKTYHFIYYHCKYNTILSSRTGGRWPKPCLMASVQQVFFSSGCSASISISKRTQDPILFREGLTH